MRFQSGSFVAAALVARAVALPAEAATTTQATTIKPTSVKSTSSLPFGSSTCPSLSLPPRTTTTSTSISYSTTFTYTSILDVPVVTATIYTSTQTYLQTSPVYVNDGTKTVTIPRYTSTVTVTKSGPSTATETTYRPSTCGFTPVKSEPIYRGSTKLIRKTTKTTVTSYGNSYRYTDTTTQGAYYRTDTTVTETRSYTDTVYTSQPDRTVKYTVTPSATTVYQACGTDNVVARAPNGSGFSSYGITQTNSTLRDVGFAADAVACCARCQNIPFCAGSLFFSGKATCVIVSVDTNQPDSQACANNAITYGEVLTSQVEEDYIVVSNGRCGQIEVKYFET